MFGRGRTDISIQKTRFAIGDTISGIITLTLKKPVKAREMTLSLIGEYVTTVTARVIGPVPRVSKGGYYHFGFGGRPLQSDTTRKITPMHHYKKFTKNVRVYGFKEQLDGEVEYSQSEKYRFGIKITGDMPTSLVVNWYLLAKLDIPHGRNIIKKIPIIIG